MAGSSPAQRCSALSSWCAWATAVAAVLVALSGRPSVPEEGAPGAAIQARRPAPAYAPAPWQCRNQPEHDAVGQVCQQLTITFCCSTLGCARGTYRSCCMLHHELFDFKPGPSSTGCGLLSCNQPIWIVGVFWRCYYTPGACKLPKSRAAAAKQGLAVAPVRWLTRVGAR